jgi:hypothetical protein
MGEPVQNSGASTLTELELQILEFERQWWRYPGSKEAAIRELFSISTPRYYQLLYGGYVACGRAELRLDPRSPL